MEFPCRSCSGIVAYAYDGCKPTVKLTKREKQLLLSKIIAHSGT